MTFAISGLVPGERLASLTIEENSDTFTTTETSLGSIKVPCIEGHIYKVVFNGSFSGSVDGSRMFVALVYIDPTDLDGSSNVLQQVNVVNVSAGTNAGWPVYLEAEHSADWTGEVEFRVTGDQVDGTGTNHLVAGPGRKALLYAEYARAA